MPDRVFLHIGLPKTGTTYLQRSLWANRELLRERGLLLPGSGHRAHLLASLELREDPSLARRAGPDARPWTDLVTEAGRFDGDVLVTHEFFGAASQEQVRRAVAAFPGSRVEVLVTARPMVDLGISRWQEWIKNGARGAIDDYPPGAGYDPADEWGWGSFDLDDVLRRWGSVIDHDRIHVLPLAPGSPPVELLERFLGVLGQDPAGLRLRDRPSNETLGLVEVELLRRVNRHLRGFRSASDRGTWIRGYLAGVIASGRERTRPGDDTLAELELRGERAVARLADGYDLRGEVEWLRPSDVSDRRQPGEVTDGEMLEAATRVIAQLMSDLRERSPAGPHRAPAPAPPPTTGVSGLARRLRPGRGKTRA